MTARSQLMPALRALLLPTRRSLPTAPARALGVFFRSIGVVADDFERWIDFNLGLWQDLGNAPPVLKRAVHVVLCASDPALGTQLGENYFAIHRELVEKHFLGHEEARAFLSGALFMCELALTERWTAAQIAKVMSGRGEHVSYSRQTVSLLLAKMNISTAVPLDQMIHLHSRDSTMSLSYFADADANAASGIVAELAARLGCHVPLEPELCALAPEARVNQHTPYLQMLHFQCVIAELFDHAVLDIYEFMPRGQVAEWLFNQYPNTMSNSNDPFLNNAKAVETLDEKWVRSKRQAERRGALALVRTLNGLDGMAFEPRRELAKILRMWIHRIINLSEPLQVVLPIVLSDQQIARMLLALVHGNTETYGILEQRVLDAISEALHPATVGWRSRGIGDSVNTTNTSQIKIGDCDFQHSERRLITAYEAHGGDLTPVYVDEHVRTLGKTMQRRANEMAGIAELSEWAVELVFVAHRLSVRARAAVLMNGVRVTFRFMTFADLVDIVPPSPLDWGGRLLRPLGQRGTPNDIRSSCLQIFGQP